jgi:hypothetical protein
MTELEQWFERVNYYFSPEYACESGLRAAVVAHCTRSVYDAVSTNNRPALVTNIHLREVCRNGRHSWSPTDTVDWRAAERVFAVLARRAARQPEWGIGIAHQIATTLHEALLALPATARDVPSRIEFGKSLRRITTLHQAVPTPHRAAPETELSTDTYLSSKGKQDQ